jgi:hypothetical protein
MSRNRLYRKRATPRILSAAPQPRSERKGMLKLLQQLFWGAPSAPGIWFRATAYLGWRGLLCGTPSDGESPITIRSGGVTSFVSGLVGGLKGLTPEQQLAAASAKEAASGLSTVTSIAGNVGQAVGGAATAFVSQSFGQSLLWREHASFVTRLTTACSRRGNPAPGPGHFNHPLSTTSQVERRLPVARGARASMPAVTGAGSSPARPSVWPGAGPSWSSRPRHFAPAHRSAPAIQAAARA